MAGTGLKGPAPSGRSNVLMRQTCGIYAARPMGRSHVIRKSVTCDALQTTIKSTSAFQRHTIENTSVLASINRSRPPRCLTNALLHRFIGAQNSGAYMSCPFESGRTKPNCPYEKTVSHGWGPANNISRCKCSFATHGRNIYRVVHLQVSQHVFCGQCPGKPPTW